MSASSDQSEVNYAILRDCFASPIIAKSAPQISAGSGQRKHKIGRKTATAPTPISTAEPEGTDAEDLADFIDVIYLWLSSYDDVQNKLTPSSQYIAYETFLSFPSELKTFSYTAMKNSSYLAEVYTDPLPPTTLSRLIAQIPPAVIDSLLTYFYISSSSLPNFISPIFTSYIIAITQPPPPLLTTERASACEICDRDWIPLTYHHLIPRSTHAKCLKRGWHEEWRLNSVAWLCRACHSFVHELGSNEELARNLYSLKLLMDREDVRKWGAWVGKVRWRKR